MLELEGELAKRLEKTFPISEGERDGEGYVIYIYKQLYLLGRCRKVTPVTYGHQCLREPVQ